jgi:hypothetical protein
MRTRLGWLQERERIFPALLGVGAVVVVAGLLTAELEGALDTSALHLRNLAGTVLFLGTCIMALAVLLWLATPPRRESRPAAGREAWLCPNCLTAYVPGAHFCPHCAAPVDEFAGRGPYEQVYAATWIAGKAARAPTRPLHVLGLAALVLVYLYWEWLAAVLVLALLVVALSKSGHHAAKPSYGVPPWWTHDIEWELEPPDERPTSGEV